MPEKFKLILKAGRVDLLGVSTGELTREEADIYLENMGLILKAASQRYTYQVPKGMMITSPGGIVRGPGQRVPGSFIQTSEEEWLDYLRGAEGWQIDDYTEGDTLTDVEERSWEENAAEFIQNSMIDGNRALDVTKDLLSYLKDELGVESFSEVVEETVNTIAESISGALEEAVDRMELTNRAMQVVTGGDIVEEELEEELIAEEEIPEVVDTSKEGYYDISRSIRTGKGLFMSLYDVVYEFAALVSSNQKDSAAKFVEIMRENVARNLPHRINASDVARIENTLHTAILTTSEGGYIFLDSEYFNELREKVNYTLTEADKRTLTTKTIKEKQRIRKDTIEFLEKTHPEMLRKSGGKIIMNLDKVKVLTPSMAMEWSKNPEILEKITDLLVPVDRGTAFTSSHRMLTQFTSKLMSTLYSGEGGSEENKFPYETSLTPVSPFPGVNGRSGEVSERFRAYIMEKSSTPGMRKKYSPVAEFAGDDGVSILTSNKLKFSKQAAEQLHLEAKRTQLIMENGFGKTLNVAEQESAAVFGLMDIISQYISHNTGGEHITVDKDGNILVPYDDSDEGKLKTSTFVEKEANIFKLLLGGNIPEGMKYDIHSGCFVSGFEIGEDGTIGDGVALPGTIFKRIRFMPDVDREGNVGWDKVPGLKEFLLTHMSGEKEYTDSEILKFLSYTDVVIPTQYLTTNAMHTYAKDFTFSGSHARIGGEEVDWSTGDLEEINNIFSSTVRPHAPPQYLVDKFTSSMTTQNHGDPVAQSEHNDLVGKIERGALLALSGNKLLMAKGSALKQVTMELGDDGKLTDKTLEDIDDLALPAVVSTVNDLVKEKRGVEAKLLTEYLLSRVDTDIDTATQHVPLEHRDRAVAQLKEFFAKERAALVDIGNDGEKASGGAAGQTWEFVQGLSVVLGAIQGDSRAGETLSFNTVKVGNVEIPQMSWTDEKGRQISFNTHASNTGMVDYVYSIKDGNKLTVVPIEMKMVKDRHEAPHIGAEGPFIEEVFRQWMLAGGGSGEDLQVEFGKTILLSTPQRYNVTEGRRVESGEAKTFYTGALDMSLSGKEWGQYSRGGSVGGILSLIAVNEFRGAHIL